MQKPAVPRETGDLGGDDEGDIPENARDGVRKVGQGN